MEAKYWVDKAWVDENGSWQQTVDRLHFLISCVSSLALLALYPVHVGGGKWPGIHCLHRHEIYGVAYTIVNKLFTFSVALTSMSQPISLVWKMPTMLCETMMMKHSTLHLQELFPHYFVHCSRTLWHWMMPWLPHRSQDINIKHLFWLQTTQSCLIGSMTLPCGKLAIILAQQSSIQGNFMHTWCEQ